MPYNHIFHNHIFYSDPSFSSFTEFIVHDWSSFFMCAILWSMAMVNTITCHIVKHGNCRLLNPDLDSSGSLFVGSYILQLILHLSSHMALHIRDLVVALVRRMETSEIVGLKNSILLIFARLVCDFFQGNSFHFSNIHNCFGSSFFYIAIVLFLFFSFAGAFERSKCWEIYQFTSNYTSKRLWK